MSRGDTGVSTPARAARGLVIVVACLLAVSLVAAPAAAVEVTSEDLPEEVEVDSQTEATFEFTDLFDEYESWTLQGETNLTNVTWTVRQYDQAGNQVSQESYDGTTFEGDIDIDDGTSTVEVRVTGTVPEIENLSYDPPETFTYANFTLARGGGTEQAIASFPVHHYTADSKSAREAIDRASESVDRSGGGGSADLDRAINAYEQGNFDLAEDLAADAESQGNTRQMLFVGAGAVVVLGLVVGGVFVYRSRQQGPSRLR